MALPNNRRPGRLAQDTARVLRETLEEKAAQPAAQSAAPRDTKPKYARTNTEAVEYGDNRYAIGANQSRTVSPARPGRRYFFILVTGANAATVSFGKPAAAGVGIPLPANGFYEPLVPPAGSINVFSVAGTEVTVVEG